MAQATLDKPKCPFCFSSDTELVASDQNNIAVIIRCRTCGKRSEIDMENPNVDLNDPRHGDVRQ